MKNSTILFGFIILVTLLSMVSNKSIEMTDKKVCFNKESDISQHSIEQLPIISIKKD